MTGDLFPEVQPQNGNLDENQRYTTRHALSWCKAKAGVTDYDLDVAACAEAHHAPNWYDGKERGSGLIEPWYGDVWCNPPWDDIEPWVRRAWQAWSEPEFDGLSLISISMLLPMRGNRPWWQNLVEPFRDTRRHHSPLRSFGQSGGFAQLFTHHPPERFTYGHPGNPEAIGVGEPNFTSVLLVWRGI